MSDCPTAKMINLRLWERQRELFDALSRAGGVRGLFDMGSAEWSRVDVPEKREILRRLWATGIPPREVRVAAAEIIVAHGYGALDARFSVLEATATLFDDSLVKGTP